LSTRQYSDFLVLYIMTSNTNSQQLDQQQQQPSSVNSNNLWNSDVSGARANQPFTGSASANFGLGMNTNEASNLSRSNVMDALMIARLQQNQDQHQQQHDALRRLSIDTIGSSHRSVGLDGANGLMSVAGRFNNNNLLQQANTLQQQQHLLNNSSQFLSPQQRANELQSQLHQAGIGAGSNMNTGGLYPRSDSLSFMQNLDPSSAAVANLRFQQGLAGMGASGMSAAAGSHLSQPRMTGNGLPGNQLDFSNANSNPMLDVDLLYRAYLQQQKQQSDSLLQLQRNQQQFMNFGKDPSSLNDIAGSNRLEPHCMGISGLDQNRFQQQNINNQHTRPMGSDQLDWSRNSNSNMDSLATNTLLSLQQQQQSTAMNHINYQSNANNPMMNLEEQLAMTNSMWNYPSSMLSLQQQHQLFSQQFHGAEVLGNTNGLEGDAGSGGIGSASLLSALFAESGQSPFDLGMPSNAVSASGSGFGNTNSVGNNAGTATSAANKASKAATDSTVQLPVRALSAYNFFFRDERERIINCQDDVDPLEPNSLKSNRNPASLNEAKKKQLLAGHWYRDRSVKRRHRKTHGKIAFTALSKVISQAWRDLPDSEKAFYREVAAEDLERYQRELEQYKVVDGVEGMAKSSNIHDQNIVEDSTREPV
jgi:hypothetical protein